MTEWIQYLGRWHVALVHFPIGLLITAALVELVGVWRRFHAPTISAFIMVCCGAFAAVVASSLGWILAADTRHPGAEDIVELHRWAGVVTSALALTSAAAGWAALRGRLRFKRPFRILVLITAVGVAVTGHWGGELIYGDDYFDLPGTASAGELDEPLEEQEP